MDVDQAREFVREQHDAVLMTRRRDGSPQLSPITCGVDDDGMVVVSTRETAMKVRNIRRDPSVSLCVVSKGFYGKWVQIDGRAEVVALPDAMELLVDYYRSISGEHPDWDDYRAAMAREQRVVLRIRIERAGPDRVGVTYDPPGGVAAVSGAARSSPYAGGAGLDVAIAVLAAGRGSRFGGDDAKCLQVWQGKALVTWALDAALASGLSPVYLVSGYQHRQVDAMAPAGVDVVHNRHWKDGISRSLRAALDAIDGYASVGAVCIGLADQPRVGAAAYQRLAAAFGDGAQLAVATYGGERGNPVLLARRLWAEAHELTGDVGARVLMQRHPVVEVPCDDTGSPHDVDTPADLDHL